MTDYVSKISGIRADDAGRFLIFFSLRLTSIARTYYLDRPIDADIESSADALGDINELVNAALALQVSLSSESAPSPSIIEDRLKDKISGAAGGITRLFGDANWAAESALLALRSTNGSEGS